MKLEFVECNKCASQSGTPTNYDNKYICLKCSGENDIVAKDMINGDICDCKTKCRKCGYEGNC